jgi:uncharacterized protein with NAD-binding domain and iron-sulfur cluster
MPQNPKKIAILGGGVGGLAAAFSLTDQPGWQQLFDITVYQMGWRLGGKGASGRNPDQANRVEEHGLHIWMGCYENAFAMIQNCYTELSRPPGSPLATWRDAFKPQNLVSLLEKVRGRWLRWDANFPTIPSVPGQGGACPTPWNFIVRLLEWMVERYFQAKTGALAPARGDLDELAPGVHLESAHQHAVALKDEPPQFHLTFDHWGIIGQLEQFLEKLWEVVRDVIDSNDQVRRIWILLSLAGTLVRGILTDGVLHTGFDPLDQYDFREWLKRHGAEDLEVWSAPVQALYDLVFAYEGGDMAKPNFAAGVALRALLRTTWGYQEAFAYKMQAGMGDVVFTPLYLVLRRRGVKFKFFHRVEELVPTADGRSIAAVRVGRQATLTPGPKPPPAGCPGLPPADYEPLVSAENLLCWPSAPRYEQLAEGPELKRLAEEGYEPLESAWSKWPNREVITLRAGQEFDLVILGIPVGSLRYLTPKLMEANPRWRAMVENVKTVQTQAFQLWLNRDADGLGWHAKETALFGAYRASGSDMSQLIPRESWPAGAQVHNIPYFCNPLQDDPNAPAPFTDPDFPKKQADLVKGISLDFLKTGGATAIWPLAAGANPDELNWDLLIDLKNGQGAQRFDRQFWRANIDPNERYVLSVKDSTQYRLRADESGFANLYLTGDWVLTGLNAGCVEAAVMAGMQTSRALCGRPAQVFGETDACGGWWGTQLVATTITAVTSITTVTAVPATAAAPAPVPAAPPGNPLYVDRGGEQVYPHPIGFTGVKFYSFLLEADAGALRELCDKYLNRPSAGAVAYTPLLPRILLGVAVIERAQPVDGPASRLGWIPEIDAAFWVPVMALQRRGDRSMASHLAWFQPYLFIDHPWAAAAGREIYGFAKAMARIQAPRKLGEPAVFKIATPAVPQPDPQAEVQWRDLVNLTRTDAQNDVSLSALFSHPLEVLGHFARTLVPNGELLKLAEEIPGIALSTFMHPREVPVVFLKQFRDVADPRRACYQAIVEAPARVTSFQGAGLLDGSYALDVTQCMTHPIVRELGLRGAQQPVLGAWHVDFGFVMETGTEVWRA